MLQADFETLVSACAGGSIDRKITCETLATDDDHKTDLPDRRPDSPPEAVWLSKDEEHDWLDRHAVYERKESTKGSTSSAATSTNSQRFSLNLKSKAGMIGLPKPQKPSFVDAKNRKPCNNNIRLFPKRSVSVTKSVSAHAEPSSPKVSCMGRVRSKRERNRMRSSRRSSSDAGEKPSRSSFFGSFRAIFRSGTRKKPHRETDPAAADSTVKARDSTASVNDASFAESISRNSVSESEPPGLGGMMRFASGRRSESWGGGGSEIHVSR